MKQTVKIKKSSSGGIMSIKILYVVQVKEGDEDALLPIYRVNHNSRAAGGIFCAVMRDLFDSVEVEIKGTTPIKQLDAIDISRMDKIPRGEYLYDATESEKQSASHDAETKVEYKRVAP